MICSRKGSNSFAIHRLDRLYASLRSHDSANVSALGIGIGLHMRISQALNAVAASARLEPMSVMSLRLLRARRYQESGSVNCKYYAAVHDRDGSLIANLDNEPRIKAERIRRGQRTPMYAIPLQLRSRSGRNHLLR